MFILAFAPPTTFLAKVVIAIIFHALIVLLVRTLFKRPVSVLSQAISVAVTILIVMLLESLLSDSYFWLHTRGGLAAIVGVFSAAFCLWPKTQPRPDTEKVLKQKKCRWWKHPIFNVCLGFLLGPLVGYLFALLSVSINVSHSKDVEFMNLQTYNNYISTYEMQKQQTYETYLTMGMLAGCAMAVALSLIFTKSWWTRRRTVNKKP